VQLEVAIDAVVAGIQLAADEPLPERWIAGVQRGVPILIPVKKIGVFAKTFGEIFLAEALHDGWVVKIGLPDEFCRGTEEFLFFPVDGDLGFVFPGFGLALRRFWLSIRFVGGFARFSDGHDFPLETRIAAEIIRAKNFQREKKSHGKPEQARGINVELA
jgi:hypothetical protein